MQPTILDPANLFRLVHLFDILASGALVASRKGMDVMGFMWERWRIDSKDSVGD